VQRVIDHSNGFKERLRASPYAEDAVNLVAAGKPEIAAYCVSF
jgi:hypothetical protein